MSVVACLGVCMCLCVGCVGCDLSFPLSLALPLFLERARVSLAAPMHRTHAPLEGARASLAAPMHRHSLHPCTASLHPCTAHGRRSLQPCTAAQRARGLSPNRPGASLLSPHPCPPTQQARGLSPNRPGASLLRPTGQGPLASHPHMCFRPRGPDPFDHTDRDGQIVG